MTTLATGQKSTGMGCGRPAAKAKPGSFTFASVGIGTATHLSAERFRASAAIEALHVPFRGGSQAVVEVMAGRVDFFFGPIGLVLPYVGEGKLVALAVNGAQRTAALPNVPTTLEAGFADQADVALVQVSHGWHQTDRHTASLPLRCQSLHGRNRRNRSHGGKLL